MKRLLRSIIDFEDQKVSKDALNVNYQRLHASKIEWSQPVDEKIFGYIREFFNNNFELPTALTIQDFFERSEDIEVAERLKDIKASPAYVHKNYAHLLSTLIEDQNRIKMRVLLKDTEEIVSKGRLIQEGAEKVKLQGVKDALIYFTKRGHELLPTDSNTRTHGDLREDGEQAWLEYQQAKRERGKVWGAFTGINEIDKVCHGCKRGEMWVHAAFVGELKTTLSLNWCYNLVTRYKTNVFYVSLEMPYEQLRRNISAIHTSNKKWAVQGKKPLDYRKVRDGELSDEEEEFLRESLEDFEKNPDYCRFEVWSPDHDVTIDDIRVEAELKHKEMDVGFIVIDHGGLVEATRKHKDYTIELNSVLRAAKKTLALHFNGGEGVPVLMLFQLNRQGKDEADKNEGRYKIKALSYANECLASHTLVKTKRGLVSIELVRQGDFVWSRTGWKHVLALLDNGRRQTYEIRTSAGISLVTTGTHRVRIYDPELGVEWRATRNLRPGDWIISDVGTRPFPYAPRTLPPLEFQIYDKPNGGQGVPLRCPSVMTDDLAYLAGAYKGDGVKGDDYRFGYTGNRLETCVREAIQTRFLRTFGHPLGQVLSPSRKGSFDLMKWSKPLRRWVHKIGMTRDPGTPWPILAGTESQVIAYLKGLWDTDGSINNQGLLYLGQKLSHRQTMEEAQLLMADLGIHTDLRVVVQKLNDKKYLQAILRVRGYASCLRFSQIIGFTEPHKSKRLRSHLLGLASSRINRREPLPIKAAFDATVRAHRDLFSKCRSILGALRQKGSTVPMGAVADVIKILDNHGIPHTLTALTQGVRFVRVEEVVRSQRQQVWDLEVTGDHEYATAGFLSHNCERSADYITTTYLNDQHRENGTTLFCNLKNRDNPLFPPFQASVDFVCRRISNFDPTVSRVSGMRVDTPEGNDELLKGMLEGL